MGAEQAKREEIPAVVIPIEIKKYGGRVIGTHSMEIDRELTMGASGTNTEPAVRKIIHDEITRRFPEATRAIALENGIRKTGRFEAVQMYLIIIIVEK
ncbi:MAG: hypothetical protein AAB513_00695 [Patescibacteria group bacterium]